MNRAAIPSIASVPLVCEDCGQLLTAAEAEAMRWGAAHDCWTAGTELARGRVETLERMIVGQERQIVIEEADLRRLTAELVRAKEHLRQRLDALEKIP